MNKFFIENKNINSDNIIITDKEDIKHISKVLRLRVNDLVEVSDGIKFEYICKIINIDTDGVTLLINEKSEHEREAQVKVTLFQGVPKQSKMELIVQKAVEIGVNDITPVFTKRTIVVDNGKFDKKVERWNKISEEAAKQSKRGIIPVVNQAIDFKEMVKITEAYDLVLFFYENINEQSLKSVLKEKSTAVKIAVIIGPEGGFSDEEAEVLMETKAYGLSLGKRILRTETAGLSALSIIYYELEG